MSILFLLRFLAIGRRAAARVRTYAAVACPFDVCGCVHCIRHQVYIMFDRFLLGVKIKFAPLVFNG